MRLKVPNHRSRPTKFKKTSGANFLILSQSRTPGVSKNGLRTREFYEKKNELHLFHKSDQLTPQAQLWVKHNVGDKDSCLDRGTETFEGRDVIYS